VAPHISILYSNEIHGMFSQFRRLHFII